MLINQQLAVVALLQRELGDALIRKFVVKVTNMNMFRICNIGYMIKINA